MKNNEMENEFIPYEQALELKKIGFDEMCFGWYDSKYQYIINYDHTTNSCGWLNGSHCSAPTFSQCFKFFREKYDLVIQYIPYELDNEEGQSILHHKYKISEYDNWRGGRRNTIETELCDEYEEAEIACLNKLIEIIKKL